MKCSWCHRTVKEVVPIQTTRDDHYDGGVEEMIEDGYTLPSNVTTTYMEACKDCVERGYIKNLNAQQMRERHERRDRFHRAERRMFG